MAVSLSQSISTLRKGKHILPFSSFDHLFSYWICPSFFSNFALFHPSKFRISFLFFLRESHARLTVRVREGMEEEEIPFIRVVPSLLPLQRLLPSLLFLRRQRIEEGWEIISLVPASHLLMIPSSSPFFFLLLYPSPSYPRHSFTRERNNGDSENWEVPDSPTLRLSKKCGERKEGGRGGYPPPPPFSSLTLLFLFSTSCHGVNLL